MLCKICTFPVLRIEHANLNMLTPQGFPLAGDLSLLVCNRCQFVYNSSLSTAKDYMEYYRTFNKHQERSGELIKVDTEYFSQLVSFIASEGNFDFRDKKVLDFGSGALLFSELAIKEGAKIAKNYDVGLSQPEGLKFDLIISTHTFEHLLDPVTEFIELTESLSDEGLILIAVPDLQNYPRTYYGPYSHFDLEHINHFSKSSLTELFHRNGIEVVASRQSERLVSPTLAYSEILLLGRRSRVKLENDREDLFSASHTISNLMRRYDEDLVVMKEAFLQTLKRAKSNNHYALALYGISSYAFRFLNQLKLEGFLQEIGFYGDSDTRLKKLSIAEQPIMDKETFFEQLRLQTRAGKQVYVLLCAINAYRIFEMFEREERIEGVNVIMLPPDSQNRRDNI